MINKVIYPLFYNQILVFVQEFFKLFALSRREIIFTRYS